MIGGQFNMTDKKIMNVVRPETLLESDNCDFVQPSAKEVRDILRIAELTGSAAGRLTGVDSRTVRKWTGGEAKIQYSPWRILCQYVGLVKPVVKN